MKAFLGSWVGPDEYTTEVEYTISETDGKLAVSARDAADGELAKVSEVDVDNTYLRFVTKWSSGRICRCQLDIIEDNEAELTFIFTDRARLVRKR